jgi:fucose permease
MWPTAIAVGVRGSDNDEPAAAGDIRAMAGTGMVMSPLMGLVSKPCGFHAPHGFEAVKELRNKALTTETQRH